MHNRRDSDRSIQRLHIWPARVRHHFYLALHFLLQVGRVSLHLLSPLLGRFKDQLYKRPTPELGGGGGLVGTRRDVGQGGESGTFNKTRRLAVVRVVFMLNLYSYPTTSTSTPSVRPDYLSQDGHKLCVQAVKHGKAKSVATACEESKINCQRTGYEYATKQALKKIIMK